MKAAAATPSEITAHFHRKIPISRELGIEVREVSTTSAVLFVPLAPNINHVQTAFGGSLYAASALSCYALFQALSKAAGGLSDELVIQEGSIRYLAPVDADFTVHARLSKDGDEKRFVEGLQRHGKARLILEASVMAGGRECARFQGTYVFSASAK